MPLRRKSYPVLKIIRGVCGREAFHEYLQKHVPDAVFLIDNKKHGARWNFHRALSFAGESACLHLEDDVLLTRDFSRKVYQIVQDRPRSVIQFFSMRKADIEIGSREERGGSFMMNQCFYLPPNIGKSLLAFYHQWDGRHVHKSANDIFLADFMKQQKMRYYLHVPSLVQHRDCVSAIDPRRSRSRQSKTFLDPVLP
jgi:GR25 family glycosyltransferase involved in LPS biosynthesis